MINQIQHETTEAVLSIEEGAQEVEHGKDLVTRAGKMIETIIDGAESVIDISVEVAKASEEQ